MPKVHEMIESKFLKKEDAGTGVLGTISLVDQQNVAIQGAEPEMKWCMHFKELDKPMVLNSTNLQLAKAALGSDDTDDWIGKQIVLYNDPNVSFAGKLTGGIRLRATRMKTPPKTAEAARKLAEMEDDIPF
jgi:hypothetical protein